MIKPIAAIIVIGIGCFLIFSGYGNEAEPTGQVVKMFQPVDEEGTAETATVVGPGDPLRISPDILVIDQGSSKGLTIAFYNNEGDDVVATTPPRMTCDGTHEFALDVMGKLVRPNTIGEYQANVRAPLEIIAGSYRRKITLSGAQASFTVIVR